jgi:hypothetical protein
LASYKADVVLSLHAVSDADAQEVTLVGPYLIVGERLRPNITEDKRRRAASAARTAVKAHRGEHGPGLLTNLYNERPQWLADVHRDLDAAVAAAYGWPADISEEDALARLLELNLARAGTATPSASLIEENDQED